MTRMDANICIHAAICIPRLSVLSLNLGIHMTYLHIRTECIEQPYECIEQPYVYLG
jgi:hypothetical protein